MRTIAVCVALGLATINAKASPPEYENDPFGDADFQQAPLILEVNHPTRGHGDLSLMFATSLVDKYNSHLGGLLDFNYHVLETIGVGFTFGYLHGQLTNIVTDDQGIIGNGMSACIGDSARCSEIDANVPDYKQITGVADLIVTWTPLYGKVNLVSEIDLNLQIYGLGGLGVNGTREVVATPNASPSRASDYTLSGGGLLEGGAFANLKVNGTVGFGMKIYFLSWLALRAEVRGIFFGDEFDFDETNNPKTYLSSYWFGHAGLAFTLF